jgi:DNA polymerase III delta prime subunit
LFPFFILLYSIIVGVQGSTQKVISHEKRVSSNIVNNKVYKRGSRPEVPQHSLVLSSSQELQASKLRELRFSEYSPLGLNAVLIGGPRTQFSTDTLNFFQKLLCKEASKSSARDSLAPENLRSPSDAFLVPQSSLIQKYFLEGVYISTQIFVFLILQTLVSENNFGRNNPLKQKDSKSNQARILWPKQNRLKKFLFWKDNSQKQNKGIPDLPGIQEVTSLIEILVESLQNKRTGELRWRANNEVLGGRMVKAPRRSFAKGGTPLGQQSSSPGTSLGDLQDEGSARSSSARDRRSSPPSRTGGHHLFVSEAHQISSFPKGYLFVGPPGTGKTLLAQEIAQLAQVPFICVSASEIQKQIEIGTRIGALRLRKLFQQAQSLSPCILFFDEIDAIAQRQSQHDSKLFTEFLIQMDGFQSERNLGGRRRGEGSRESKAPSPHSVILGTTNYLAKLDSAFVRSGRFDRILALTYPSKKIRFDILVFYIKKTQHKELLISSFPVPPSRSIDQKRGGQSEARAERSRALLTCATEATTSRSSGDRRSSTTSSKSDQTADRTADQRSQAPKDEIFASLGLNYFSFSTDGFSQAHLARLVNESLLFTISQKLGANLYSFGHSDQYGGEQLRSGQLRPPHPRAKLATNVLSDRRSGARTGGRVPLHSFQSLLHGLKQMKRHRKNLPQDNMFIG